MLLSRQGSTTNVIVITENGCSELSSNWAWEKHEFISYLTTYGQIVRQTPSSLALVESSIKEKESSKSAMTDLAE